MTDNFWGDLKVEKDETISRDIGPLRIWFKKVMNEIWIATQYEVNGTFPENSNLLNWTRWTSSHTNFYLKLIPVVPDKPVIISPEYPFRVVKNADARVFTRIPLWVRVIMVDGSEQILIEIPTIVLSKTWFGDSVEGELCYWISTSARRAIEESHITNYLCICALDIHNKAESDLHVEKICFRVERLSLFKKDGQVWSDETEITYRGDQQHSDIVMTGKVPSEAKSAQKIAKPRNPLKKSIATRTFQKLRVLPLFWD